MSGHVASSRFSLVDSSELRPAFERIRDAGGAVQTNLQLPVVPWSLVAADLTCVATVSGPGDAAEAIVAALRGVSLVLFVGHDASWAGRVDFLEDLDRLRSIAPDGPSSAPAALLAPMPEIGPDQGDILELLAEGLSLPEAAGRLFLSLRTTERRLSAAKRLLGVRSTAEAVVAFVAGRNKLAGFGDLDFQPGSYARSRPSGPQEV